MRHGYDIHINYDEIDLICDRIEEIQSKKDSSGRIPPEFIEEYGALFKLKNILFEANRITDPTDYFVYGTMRIHKKDIDKVLLLANKVHVKGLDLYFPSFTEQGYGNTHLSQTELKDFDVAGEAAKKANGKITKPVETYDRGGYDQDEIEERIKNDAILRATIKKIKVKSPTQTIPEYEEYLQGFYKNLIDLENVSYYPGTTVPVVRKPYPHEMVVLTEDGYQFDSEFFGRRNEYYLEMVDFYTKERDRQLEEQKQSLLEREYVSPLDRRKIKVVKVENIPQDVVDKAEELVEEYSEGGLETVVSDNVSEEVSTGVKTLLDGLDEPERIKVIQAIRADLGLIDDAKKTVHILLNNGDLSKILTPDEAYIVKDTKNEEKSSKLTQEVTKEDSKNLESDKFDDEVDLPPEIEHVDVDSIDDILFNDEIEEPVVEVESRTEILDDGIEVITTSPVKKSFDEISKSNDIINASVVNGKVVKDVDDYLEVVEVSNGKPLYDVISKKLLEAFGVNDGIDASLTQEQADSIIDVNESIKRENPSVASVIEQLNELVPVRVVEPAKNVDSDGVWVMSDYDVVKELQETTPNASVKKEEPEKEATLEDSFVFDDSLSVLSSDDLLNYVGVTFEDEEQPKKGM